MLLFLFNGKFATELLSQGINTEFGQNRLNSTKTDWKILDDQDVNVLYYKGGQEHAKFAWQQFKLMLPEIQKELLHSLSGVSSIVVYNNLSDYLNGNVGITNPEYNYAGQTKMINNRLVVYYNGNNYDFARQIKKEIAKIAINEMLYGGSLNERLQNAALLKIPIWFNEGLAEYLGKGWDTDIDNWAREFFLNTDFKNMNEFPYETKLKIGRSIWYYLKTTEGKKIIPDILFQTRVSYRYEDGIGFSTGLRLNDFYEKWFSEYKRIYESEVSSTISAFGKEKVPEKLKKLPNTQFKISPNGEQAAFVVNDKGKYTIWLHDFNKSKSVKLLTGGYKIINKGVDYDFPIIDWNKNNNALGVLLYKNGVYQLAEYKKDKNGKYKSKNNISKENDISKFSYVNDFCYLNDEIAISGIWLGKGNLQSDIFVFDNKGKWTNRITKSAGVEYSLKWLEEEGLVYIHMKDTGINLKNTLPKQEIITLNTEDLKQEIVYETSGIERIRQPMMLNKDYYIFLSNRSGIVNSYLLPKKDSRSRKPLALSNYNRNILFQDINLNSELGADMLYENKQYHIISYSLAENPLDDTKDIDIKQTYFAKMKIANIGQSKNLNTPIPDSSTTLLKDTLKYSTKIQTGFKKVDYKEVAAEEKLKLIQKDFTDFEYSPRFQVDFVTTQFDNSILGSYYYPSQIHPENLINGIFNAQVKLNISDITNDYTLNGGMRINSFLNGGTFFLNAGILKGRIDKKLHVFRRSILLEYADAIYHRNISSGSDLTLSYPFTETFRLELSGLVRSDKITVLSGSSVGGLTDPGINNLYSGIKSKLVYDNTKSEGLSNISGQRGTAFIENLMGLNKNLSVLNIGIDLRNYQKLHRNIIFATRGVMNTSIGKDKVLYRLGGMENLLAPTINRDNVENRDYTDFVLQSTANNLRGFNLNEQKGNSYFIINNEVRIPIFTYLYRKNIRSNFLSSIFLVPFFDIGASWEGSSPYSLDNPNNIITYNFDIYTIKVRAARDPLLYSTGIGVRAKIMGYLLKYDYGMGFKENKSQRGVHHFSLGVDF